MVSSRGLTVSSPRMECRRRLFVRVSGLTDGAEMLLEVPGSEPLSAILPELARWLDMRGVELEGGTLSLETPDGKPLDVSTSLAAQQIPSFAALRIRCGPPTGAIPELPSAPACEALPSSSPQIRPAFRTESGSVIPLDTMPAVIGRRTSTVAPDIDLSEWDPRGVVSRRHARVERRGGAVVLIPEGTTNGTYLNDGEAAPGLAAPLREGDRVRFGFAGVTLIFRLQPDRAPTNQPGPEEIGATKGE